MDYLVLRKRSDFLRIRQAETAFKFSHFIFQYAFFENPSPCLRFGFTVTKRVGNAVVRNRAKRRLREIVRLYFKEVQAEIPNHFPASLNIVLISRFSCPDAPFEVLQKHFARAMEQIKEVGGEK